MATFQNDQEPSIDSDKLSYEIFSILETNFLFGYNNHSGNGGDDGNDDDHNGSQKVRIPKQLNSPPDENGVVRKMETTRGKVCILSIDGGGMRNILSGKALAYLESALRIKSGNSEARIADFFDVAAGTGVGGIFTAMLFSTNDRSYPIFHADDTWRFLADRGKKFYGSGGGGGFLKRVFGGGSGGGAGGATSELEKEMKEAFKSLTLKDTLKPVLIPCYELTSAAPFLFSRADALETDSYDFRLWEVCRATSAEPGVFEPVVMKSIDGSTKCTAVDGGLAMSNPTAAAITHVLHNKQEFPFVRGVEDILVLSLGTGQLLEGSFDQQQVKSWKTAKDWARPIARVSSDGSADFVDHTVSMAFAQSRSSSNYVRIQANGSRLGRCGVNIDTDPSPGNIKLLTGIADEMLKQRYVESRLFSGKKIEEHSNFEKLDWFAGELVQEHRRRSCRIAPTVAFKQANTTTPKVNQRS